MEIKKNTAQNLGQCNTIILRLFFLFFLLSHYLSYSQNKGGEISYKVVMIDDTITKSILRPRLKEKIELAENKIHEIKPSLLFNDTLAVFAKNLYKYRNDDIYSLALKLIDCEKIIYTNISTGQNIFNSVEKKGIFKDNEFIVSKEIYDEWILTTDYKSIQNFKCFKATQQVSLKNDYGTFYRTITAWYCPDLPYSFGPKGYSGLPGLIFELQDRNVVFGIESINLFDKKISIELPKKGKEITFDEYESILRERIYTRMELTEEKKK